MFSNPKCGFTSSVAIAACPLKLHGTPQRQKLSLTDYQDTALVLQVLWQRRNEPGPQGTQTPNSLTANSSILRSREATQLIELADKPASLRVSRTRFSSSSGSQLRSHPTPKARTGGCRTKLLWLGDDLFCYLYAGPFCIIIIFIFDCFNT